MQHPKAALLALSQLTDNIQDPESMAAINRASVQVYRLGLGDVDKDGYIDTVGVAIAMLRDEGLNELIEGVRDSNDENYIAGRLAELVVAVAWQCRKDAYLKEIVSAREHVSRQIDSVQFL